MRTWGRNGTPWYTVVQIAEGAKAVVEFKDFFSMMKNRISDGADVPEFFRDLVAMITDVSEDEWGTTKDPSTRLTKESTLRSYAKRGLSKKFAQSIVYRLSPETFIESLESRPQGTLDLLAFDYSVYDQSVTSENVAEKLAACFVEIIQKAAGLVPKTAVERQRAMQLALDLKQRYGDYLLDEAGGCCPFPGCGRSLTVADNGALKTVFEVALIDREKEPTVGNLLALCPMCHATYSMDGSKKTLKELQSVKKLLVARKQSARLLDDMPLERGIIGVITKIKRLNEEDFLDPSLDPKDIRSKLDPKENYPLYATVKGYVDTYYVTLKGIIVSADKRGLIDYDETQDQMRAFYKRLKKAKKTKLEIFNEISEKVHKVSLQEDFYCQIVVAYFIAKCEVFDAAAE